MDIQPLHLRNEWVVLRPLEENDFEALYQVASDPLIWEQHPNPDRYKREVFMNYFNGAIASKGAMLIMDNDKKTIGCTRFYNHVPEKNQVNIGYTFFSRSCWGKPYNRSAKQLMINHVFLYTAYVIFHIGAHNLRSQKAIEKLGALKVAEEEIAYYGEKPTNNFIYRINRSEWNLK